MTTTLYNCVDVNKRQRNISNVPDLWSVEEHDIWSYIPRVQSSQDLAGKKWESDKGERFPGSYVSTVLCSPDFNGTSREHDTGSYVPKFRCSPEMYGTSRKQTKEICSHSPTLQGSCVPLISWHIMGTWQRVWCSPDLDGTNWKHQTVNRSIAAAQIVWDMCQKAGHFQSNKLS